MRGFGCNNRFAWAVALLWASAVAGNQKIITSEDIQNLQNDVQNVRHELEKAEIIPTVIDDFIPSLLVQARWSSSNKAELGNTLKPKKLQDAPSIKLVPPKDDFACRSETTYVVTLTDPDAPSRDDPKWSEMCHWIATVVSAPSNSNVACSRIYIASLHDLIEYKPPGPPPKTGKHRYVLLVFAPANGTTDKLHLSRPKDRQHWGAGEERHGVRDWSAENGLLPVGKFSVNSKHFNANQLSKLRISFTPKTKNSKQTRTQCHGPRTKTLLWKNKPVDNNGL